MSVEHFRGLCQRCKGRAVEIKTRNGAIHRGIINHVDNHYVYLHPLGPGRPLGGFGYGGFGGFGGYGGFGGTGGYGYGGGLGLGIALGAIGTLALVPFGGFI